MSLFALPACKTAGTPLRVYLLGTVEFEAALALQRQLAYDVAGDRSAAALVVCEHPPIITVGRQGSRAHILYEPEELRTLRWRIRWVNRGGGCLLHIPGQLAMYPILPLDRLALGLQSYLDGLRRVLVALLSDFGIPTSTAADGISVGERPLAHLGVAVRDWVTYYGAYLNLDPDLDCLRRVRTAAQAPPMTSLARERRGPLRAGLVRERFIEHFAAQFGMSRLSLFFEHQALGSRNGAGAVASRP
jgi:lipoyl(octanoyl) transferase